MPNNYIKIKTRRSTMHLVDPCADRYPAIHALTFFDSTLPEVALRDCAGMNPEDVAVWRAVGKFTRCREVGETLHAYRIRMIETGDFASAADKKFLRDPAPAGMRGNINSADRTIHADTKAHVIAKYRPHFSAQVM